jgi:ribosomal protein S18 acetylase RimI-like enzyme
MTAEVAAPTIRPMCDGDAQLLAHVMGWPINLLENRWDDKVAGFREALVVEVGGAPVGTVSFNEHQEFAGLLHLFAFDVAEPFRNRGIGTQLVAAIESAARDKGLTGVYLEVNVENQDAIRLYERLGFRVGGEPFLNRWTRRDGTSREVVELSHRMFKFFRCSRP